MPGRAGNSAISSIASESMTARAVPARRPAARAGLGGWFRAADRPSFAPFVRLKIPMAKLIRLLAAAIALLIPTQALAKPPVWVVRDADSTIVLFGSVHILDKGRDWRPQALNEALAK